jgi:hypothetical protein
MVTYFSYYAIRSLFVNSIHKLFVVVVVAVVVVVVVVGSTRLLAVLE